MGIRQLIDINELKLAQQLVNSTNLPVPPQLLTELKSELALKNPDKEKIIQWISSDVVLAGKVIQTINMPYYGLTTQVKSIEHAVNLFGIKKLKDIIILPAYQQAIKNAFQGYEDISEHCHQVGMIAEVIGQEVDQRLSGLYYLSGLFHDVGVLILASNVKEYLDFMKEHADGTITLPLFEKEKYGVTHASIGVLLAKHWGLAIEVCNAIYLHHTVIATYNKKVDSFSNTIAAVLQIAEYFCLNRSKTEEELALETTTLICYQSAINELMLDDVTLQDIKNNVNQVMSFF